MQENKKKISSLTPPEAELLTIFQNGGTISIAAEYAVVQPGLLVYPIPTPWCAWPFLV